MLAIIAAAFGARRGLGIALAFSVCTFVASFLGGIFWLLVSAKRMTSTEAAPGIDLAIYVKHVCIPIATIVFLVTFFVFRKN